MLRAAFMLRIVMLLMLNAALAMPSDVRADDCDRSSEEQCKEMRLECRNNRETLDRLQLINRSAIDELAMVDSPTSARYLKLSEITRFQTYKIQIYERFTKFCDERVMTTCRACF